jgi:hypothetical protein
MIPHACREKATSLSSSNLVPAERASARHHKARSALTQLDEQESIEIECHLATDVRNKTGLLPNPEIAFAGCLKFPHQNQAFNGNERSASRLFHHDLYLPVLRIYICQS